MSIHTDHDHLYMRAALKRRFTILLNPEPT